MQKGRKSVFPGGVHPTDGSDKVLSMDAAVQQYWPDTVTILSEQSFIRTIRGMHTAWKYRFSPFLHILFLL